MGRRGEELEAESSKLKGRVGVSVGVVEAGQDLRTKQALRYLEEVSWEAGRRRKVVDLKDAVKALRMARALPEKKRIRV